jgi:hypothetical protein
MRVKQNIVEYKDGSGNINKYVTFKCDKCDMFGSQWIPNNATDLMDTQKQCYCEGRP